MRLRIKSIKAQNAEMYTELEIKKRKVVDLQEDIKNKEDLLTSQGV